jgi:hypothetical protein
MGMNQMDMARQVNGGQIEAVRQEEQPYPEPGAGRQGRAHDEPRAYADGQPQPSTGAGGVYDAEGKDNTQSWMEPFVTKAMHSFTPNIFSGSRDEEILFFSAGDKVVVLDRDENDNWWFGSSEDSRGKRQGWFPTNYVQRI